MPDRKRSGEFEATCETTMDENAIEEQILKGTQATGKTYAFDEDHKRDAVAEWWFQKSDEGDVLFVVFYTQACRWSRCMGCNLPSMSSQHHIGYRSLIAQVDHLFSLPEILERRDEIDKVILSNNGSIMDEVTFSSSSLVYLLTKINIHLPGVSSVTLETRPEYVDMEELEFIRRILDEGDSPTTLELAVGFEAYDEHIRNEVFRKGLSLATFEKLVEDVAPHGFHIKCYVMQKPVPEMSDADGIKDVRDAIDFLAGLSNRMGVRINLHLNPTYVAAGTGLEVAFKAGEYAPPRLMDVARSVLHAKGTGLTVFIGLFDEGLAVEGGSCIRPGQEGAVAELERFSETQDFSILERLIAS